MLIVDAREPGWLRKKFPNAETAKLDCGDFETEFCIIERKTADDFASSIQDGRLHSQRLKLVQHPKQPIIVIVGFEQNSFRALPETSLITAVANLIVHGISVVYVRDENHFIHFIEMIEYKQTEIWTPEISAPIAPDPNERLMLCLPGIGGGRAKALAARYKFFELQDATTEELCKVPHIGLGLAEGIKKEMTRITR